VIPNPKVIGIAIRSFLNTVFSSPREGTATAVHRRMGRIEQMRSMSYAESFCAREASNCEAISKINTMAAS
jgi:hypothetical protein